MDINSIHNKIINGQDIYFDEAKYLIQNYSFGQSRYPLTSPGGMIRRDDIRHEFININGTIYGLRWEGPYDMFDELTPFRQPVELVLLDISTNVYDNADRSIDHKKVQITTNNYRTIEKNILWSFEVKKYL